MSTETGTLNFVQIAAHRIAFTRLGSGNPIVLLHGIPTHGYLWRNVAPWLAAAGLEATAVDLLGYGASDKPIEVDLGIAPQAQIIAATLDSLRWQGGAVVGHDIGGGVAQLLAVNRPDLVRQLILVDTIAYDSFPEPGIARLKDPAWDAILGAPDFDLKKGLTKAFTRGMARSERITPELIAAYERPFEGINGRLAYLRAARALRTEDLASRMHFVERLPIPVLIIWGALDPFQPVEYGERLAKSMSNARIEVMGDASHFVPEDAPEALARLIASFALHGQIGGA
jgi:pimeloyl-ACP methyl ester carboxylesterase